jgi:hypothetical protein
MTNQGIGNQFKFDPRHKAQQGLRIKLILEVLRLMIESNTPISLIGMLGDISEGLLVNKVTYKQTRERSLENSAVGHFYIR